MIILLDELPHYIVALSKLASAVVILLVAFKFYRVKQFLVSLGVFLLSSMIILGIVVAMYYMLKTDSIALNNSSVYFDISARGIIISGFVAYLLSSLFLRLYNRTLSRKELYTLVIEHNGIRATMLAMLDTGNHLHEPFSNTPVIVVSSSLVSGMLDGTQTRLVPASSVGSQTLLVAFKPDLITIKTSKGCEVIENAYIALSDDITDDSFSAILNPEILSV